MEIWNWDPSKAQYKDQNRVLLMKWAELEKLSKIKALAIISKIQCKCFKRELGINHSCLKNYLRVQSDQSELEKFKMIKKFRCKVILRKKLHKIKKL
jgi:hypothetical protein